MTIYDKGLLRAMKAAFRDNGYDLAMTENGLLIQTSDWGVLIRKDMVPSSIKSLIVLHSGDMPKMNSAIHVHKAECNDMILDAAMGTMDDLANEYTAKGGFTIKPTRLTLDSKRVWQLTDTLNVRLVDVDNQQVMTLLLGERMDTRLLGGVIFYRSWAGTIYVRTEMSLPEDRALLQHLSEMQWIPVEAE